MKQDIFSIPHCGVTFGFYAKNGYFSSPQAKDEVDEMAKTGVNWVVLVVTVMQEGFSATRQFRDFENTPNDLELKEIIDYIHSKGICVQLRPMLECFDGLDRLAVNFPADRERMPGLPCDYCSRWFDSMKKRSVYYARIAEQTGCELFCLDSELDRIICFHDQWKEVLRGVRAVYSGPVTSCHTVHTNVIDFEKELANKDHWFYELDALSLSDYIRAASHGGCSVEELMQGMEAERDRLRRIAELYQKPIFFGEIGCTSTYGAAMRPSAFSPTTPYDEQEQANFLEAVIRVFSQEPWWKGLYWWKWEEQVDRPGMVDPVKGHKGFPVRGKSAQKVMKEWFERLQGRG